MMQPSVKCNILSNYNEMPLKMLQYLYLVRVMSIVAYQLSGKGSNKQINKQKQIDAAP